jgi:uncharacterized protein (TIGR00730 family)
MTAHNTQVTVFCASSSNIDALYFEAAADLGRGLAQRDITVVFGGSFMGTMAALAEAALAAGGRVIGIMPRAYEQAWAGIGALREPQDLTACDMRLVESLAQRKEHLVNEADAIVVLPGGTGVLDELMEALVSARLGLYAGPIVIVNLNGFYDALVLQLETLVHQRMVDASSLASVHLVSSVNQGLLYVDHMLPQAKPHSAGEARL